MASTIGSSERNSSDALPVPSFSTAMLQDPNSFPECFSMLHAVNSRGSMKIKMRLVVQMSFSYMLCQTVALHAVALKAAVVRNMLVCDCRCCCVSIILDVSSCVRDIGPKRPMLHHVL